MEYRGVTIQGGSHRVQGGSHGVQEGSHGMQCTGLQGGKMRCREITIGCKEVTIWR